MAKRVVLWGHTEVGKTTILATYLEYVLSESKSWLGELSFEHENQIMTFRNVIKELRVHHLTQATSSTNEATITLPTHDSDELIFIDVKGGNTENMTEVERNAIKHADGILFFSDWPTEHDRQEMQFVIENILYLVPSICKGLVITKAEQHMDMSDGRWQGGENWLTGDANWLRFTAKFGNYFWPTTAFGYCEAQNRDSGSLHGYPACILNEFGEFLPYFKGRDEEFVHNVVSKPFDTILKEIGVI